jgi:hypothetical protein
MPHTELGKFPVEIEKMELFSQSDEDLQRQAAEVHKLANIKSGFSNHLDRRRGNDSPPFDADTFNARFELYLPAYIALLSKND